MAKRKSLAERFWAKVDKRGTDECWPWTASTINDGYGHISRHGKMFLAHRASFEMANGPIPYGLLVCHHCDNPPCVNPAHLFLGTQSDNARDRNKKGRAANWAGERHPLARLSADEIVSIRSDDRTQRKIAAEYGVSQSLIHLIKSRKAWRHIP